MVANECVPLCLSHAVGHLGHLGRLTLQIIEEGVPSCLSHAWDTWDTWDSGCTRLAPRAGSLNLGLFAPGLLAPLIRGGGSWAGCMGSSVIFASAPFLGWVHDADDALAN